MAPKGEPSLTEVTGEPIYYTRLPPPPPPDHHHYIILPVYYQPRWQRHLRRRLICLSLIILLAFTIYLFWPSDPSLTVTHLRLNHVRLHTIPIISLDISLALTVKVRNRDFFALDYDSLVVAIGYRGRQLGFANSDNGHLRARGSSYVNATLQINGIHVLHDAFYLIEDLAKGSIPFDTVTEVRGRLGLFNFEFPLKAKVSCEVYVDVENQKIIHQDCYPE